MCLTVSFAILPLRIKFYDLFLITHIALVILALIGCWHHLVPHFRFIYGYQVWLYICFAFWSADRLARLGCIAFYNVLERSTATIERIQSVTLSMLPCFRGVLRGSVPDNTLLCTSLGWASSGRVIRLVLLGGQMRKDRCQTIPLLPHLLVIQTGRRWTVSDFFHQH